MQDSTVRRASRAHQLTICLYALAGLLAVTAADASTLTISGSPPTRILSWHKYSFRPTVGAPRGYALRFSISGKPSWASFSTSTGTLSGMPLTANVGASSTVVISVSDGVARASLRAFTLKVLPNIAPRISGTPPTAATVGQRYTFTPKAMSPDGDPISFSVRNKPSWASFSIASGSLSGTPTSANLGAISGIVISVSTGHGSASLTPFSITVRSSSTSGTGSAMLHWTAPTTNTNGSALTDLAGYHIYYGKSSSALTTAITVADPATTSYTVGNLPSGTWYFAVNAYTTNGGQSAESNIRSKPIP